MTLLKHSGRPVLSVLLFSTLFVIFALALSSTIVGAVPSLVSYQGRLTTADGDPFPDDNYQISFAIYDLPAAGQPVWTETHAAVPVTDGLFGVILGSSTPFGDAAFSGAEKYLEVQVGNDIVLPRTRLTSNFYAQRVATVDGATGGVINAPLILIPEGTTATFGPDKAAAVATSRMEFSFSESSTPSISLWEPVDSKAFGIEAETKRMEFSRNGLVMFGLTEQDTTLIVAPNGDIIGVGQITMGENSSSGIETSVLGFRNVAEGDSSTIGGGSANQTTGTISVISGGHNNFASGEGATIGGGAGNQAAGNYSTISGGFNNVSFGDYASIPGGRDNVANGMHSFAFGYRSKALHNGSFVWGDQSEADFSSTGDDQFLIRASGGVGIGTDSPTGQLDVVAPPGDGSVNLPGDAIASEEIFDEPGVASTQLATSVVLTQLSATVDELMMVTITIPDDGYIVVRGSVTLETTGTSKRNQAYLQVDDASGGGLVSPHYALAGGGDYDTPSSQHYFSMSTERVFFKSAGTHVFYLEGLAHPDNNSGAVTTMQRPYMTAIYLPTSYGTVTAAAGAQSVR